MDNVLKRSKLIKERLFEVLQNNELLMCDEIEIVQYIAQERLKLTTPAQAAKDKGISFNGMKSRIKSGKEAAITLNGIKLIAV